VQGKMLFFVCLLKRVAFYVKSLGPNTILKPFLDISHFRKVVRAIQQDEPDLRKKKAFFTASLLTKRVCHDPQFRFLLFKENCTVFQQFLFLPNIEDGTSPVRL
jgi:hypothetical protein